MRLGGPVFLKGAEPGEWIAALQQYGYRAAYCPIGADASDDLVKAYANAATAAGIVIAEVGAWSNPISKNDKERTDAIAHCTTQLALADRLGALCCVNIAGSRGAQWDGPDFDNLTDDTFDLIVETVRKIIDAVRPLRAFYSLEGMPWAYPESPQSYLRIMKAIDRDRFAVHLDPVNWITSPTLYFNNAAFIRECFTLLGPYIKSCHAKDIRLSGKLTVHLDEARPGAGALDYGALLREMAKLGADTPLMLEHLETEEEYNLSAAYVRQVARREGLDL